MARDLFDAREDFGAEAGDDPRHRPEDAPPWPEDPQDPGWGDAEDFQSGAAPWPQEDPPFPEDAPPLAIPYARPPYESPLGALKDIFGFEAFRGLQAEIINHALQGGDALVLMPTGGGKSLCYQIPALCRSGVGIVVSPLIALMRDQVEALRQNGVAAAALNSSLSAREASETFRALLSGQLDLLYVAPERLLTDSFLETLERVEIALFAIDEAHCVSQWGHDFRPEYRQLSLLKERFAWVPRLALTATADGPTRRDIAERLGLEEGRHFLASFDRPNIQYHIKPRHNGRDQLLAFIKQRHKTHAGIVYCLSRRKVEETAAWLESRGLKALPYHAGLPADQRHGNQERFLREDGIIMVATIAFGMGIDKPDVRFVAHLDLPKSLEAYYQETGRAGRDGLPADAWMVYGLQDVVRLLQMIDDSEAPEAQKRLEKRKIEALLGFCETVRCRRQVLLSYFDEDLETPCGNCDTCLEPVEHYDGTEAAQKFLSCVYRTGQRFGPAHVIDVLMGSEAEKVKRFGHDRLSTWGIGRDYGREGWRSVARQLVALELVQIDHEQHGAMKLGPDVREVLRGEKTVELRRDPAKESRKALAKTQGQSERRSAGRSAETAESLDEAGYALFLQLKEKRMDLAKSQAVPPYVVFHDSSLIAMARRRPQSLEEMADLPGIGESKLQRYGEIFLALLQE